MEGKVCDLCRHFLEVQKKTRKTYQDSRSADGSLNMGPPEYESEELSQLRSSVPLYRSLEEWACFYQ